MALTLVEASKLSNDVLLTGVVETIIKDSPILQSLPFIEVVGTRKPHSQRRGVGVLRPGIGAPHCHPRLWAASGLSPTDMDGILAPHTLDRVLTAGPNGGRVLLTSHY